MRVGLLLIGSDYYPVERPNRSLCGVGVDFFCDEDEDDAMDMSWEVRSQVLQSSTANPDSSSWMCSSWPLISLSNGDRPTRAANCSFHTQGQPIFCSQDDSIEDSAKSSASTALNSVDTVLKSISGSISTTQGNDQLKHSRCTDTSTVIVGADVMDSIDLPEVCLDEGDKNTALIPHTLPWSNFVVCKSPLLPKSHRLLG